MNKQKIVVTGGAGFIGTNMLIALKSRYPDADILSIDIRKPGYPINDVTYINCDVRSKDDINIILAGVDKIFHLAAQIGTHESFEEPFKVFEINVGGTLNILDYVKNNPNTELYIAGMPGIWNNPYSISKDSAVRMAISYYETYKIKVSVLRWYSVYGPYQYISRYNKAVPTFINNALNNKPIPIYGDGNQVADFIYVDDAVNLAIDSLEQKKWGKVIHCATGIGISVNNLVEKIIKLCDSKSTVQYLPMRAGEPSNAKVIADVTDLNENYKRKLLTLDEGLAKTVLYYKGNKPVD